MAAYPLHHMLCAAAKAEGMKKEGKKGQLKGGLEYCALSVKNCVDLQQTCLRYVMDEPGL